MESRWRQNVQDFGWEDSEVRLIARDRLSPGYIHIIFGSYPGPQRYELRFSLTYQYPQTLITGSDLPYGYKAFHGFDVEPDRI